MYECVYMIPIYIYIIVCIYIYMTSILKDILPCLVPRFYEVSMDAICGYNRTFLDLLDRVSHGTESTCDKIIH